MSFVKHSLLFVAGATVYVHGRGARPTLSQCLITDSENVGIFVTDGAQVRIIRQVFTYLFIYLQI